jgi:hypothetical protein
LVPELPKNPPGGLKRATASAAGPDGLSVEIRDERLDDCLGVCGDDFGTLHRNDGFVV